MPSPLVLVDTTARINRNHLVPDIHRSPRRVIRCNPTSCTFEPHHPRILFPETYLKLASLYRETLEFKDTPNDTAVTFHAKLYESDVSGEHVQGPCGILCVSTDGVDTVSVKSHGTTLQLSPGVMFVCRDTGTTHLDVLKERDDGSACLFYISQ